MRAFRIISQIVLGWAILSIVPAYPWPRDLGMEGAAAPASVPKVVVPTVKVPARQVPVKDAPQKQEPQVPLPTANDALALAAADLKTLPADDRRFVRYLWVTDAEHESMQALALVMGYITRSTTSPRPLPLGVGRLMLLRLDLRDYAPRTKDLKEWLAAWEQFRFDPALNILLTKDTLRFAAGFEIPKVQKPVTKTRKVPSKDGKGFVDEEYVEQVEGTGFDVGDDVVRIVGQHLDPALMSYLVESTYSQAPVVSSGYFLTRALTTIQDKGVYKTVYGGLYYQLAGIPLAGKKGTDEDALFEQLGVGDVDKGLTAQSIFDDRTRSDQRIATFRSGVTGKPRRVDLIPTLAARLSDSLSFISVTHDLKAADIDVATHPMMNLLTFQDAAREAIFTKPNGMLGYALYNGQGKRQDVVPADVAIDNTVPFPNRAELQPAIGCIRCHASEGGWRVLTNDVTKLAKTLDIFGDVGGQKKSTNWFYGGDYDVIDRLVGLYSGNLELKALPRARDDYASAILKAGGPWKKSKDQTDLAKLSGNYIGELYAGHNYRQPDAVTALRDLGIEVKDAKDAPALLKKLVPPYPLDGGGFAPEDPRIAWLFAGGALNRTDYDLVFGFVAQRWAKAKGANQ